MASRKALIPAEHVLVVVGDDRRVVAYRHGGGVLKQRMAEEHHAHAVVLVHVGVEHAHMRVGRPGMKSWITISEVYPAS